MYPLTFYTDRFIPSHFAGCMMVIAFIPFIFIRPKYRDDAGLCCHELTHVRQYFRTLGLHVFLYWLFERYRFEAELEAYKEQAKHYPDDRKELFAGFIAQKYKLNITKEQVLEAWD